MLQVGWLFWALPGNLLMQKFPLNKYLAVNMSGGVDPLAGLHRCPDLHMGRFAHGTSCEPQLYRTGNLAYSFRCSS